MGRLHVVSTPIGNLGDVTYRAVETLSSATRLLTEDTRRTAVLCRRYGISTPRVSLHEHNEASRTAEALSWLAAGEELALVSDAGTPLLSDPGARLVSAAIAAGHDVVPVPGASAVLAALVASGLEVEPFAFMGFAPRTGRARETWLERVASLDFTVVVYEAPSRLARLLRDLVAQCGGDRAVTVARELTKLHETFVRGTLAETLAYYENERVRGEVVIVLGGAHPEAKPVGPDPHVLAGELLASGQRPSGVARELTRRLGIPRNEAYQIALALVAEGEREPR